MEVIGKGERKGEECVQEKDLIGYLLKRPKDYGEECEKEGQKVCLRQETQRDTGKTRNSQTRKNQGRVRQKVTGHVGLFTDS